MNCLIALLFSLVVVPTTVIGSPGLADSATDSTSLEVGEDLSFFDDAEYGRAQCGFGLRVGHQWRDYMLLEGEYSHQGDPNDGHQQTLFVAAAGPRIGLRKGGLGWFVKLQPGIIHDSSFARLKFALSVGGVMEAHLDTVGRETPAYLRFDMGYLVIPDTEGILKQVVARRPGNLYPRSSVGLVFRF